MCMACDIIASYFAVVLWEKLTYLPQKKSSTCMWYNCYILCNGFMRLCKFWQRSSFWSKKKVLTEHMIYHIYPTYKDPTEINMGGWVTNLLNATKRNGLRVLKEDSLDQNLKIVGAVLRGLRSTASIILAPLSYQALQHKPTSIKIG